MWYHSRIVSALDGSPGKLSSAGQKHFYLETQTTYAYPDGMGGPRALKTFCFEWSLFFCTPSMRPFLCCACVPLRAIEHLYAYAYERTFETHELRT